MWWAMGLYAWTYNTILQCNKKFPNIRYTPFFNFEKCWISASFLVLWLRNFAFISSLFYKSFNRGTLYQSTAQYKIVIINCAINSCMQHMNNSMQSEKTFFTRSRVRSCQVSNFGAARAVTSGAWAGASN